MSPEDRYTRQRRLPEVGASGQTRLFRARARIVGGRGALVEAAYLERCGVGAARIDPYAPAPHFRHADAFTFATSRDVAAGSWRALRTVREALGIDSE